MALTAPTLFRHELVSMPGQTVSLITFTDSQTLFNVLICNKMTTERHLMVDVAAERQIHHSMIIWNIGLIKSCYNPAVGLTKVSCNTAVANLLRTHSIYHPLTRLCYECTTRNKHDWVNVAGCPLLSQMLCFPFLRVL
jgi:hypothetical protein